jgi:hypothetical protein
MLVSLLAFVLFSIPPLVGWWLCLRAPLGRRRFEAQIVIPAPLDRVARLLDPRGADGGWSFLYETRNAARIDEDPLVLAFERRPRGSHRPFEQVEELCEMDAAGRRFTRSTQAGDGVRTEATLFEDRAGTRVVVRHESRTTGFLTHELTRLALRRDLDALQDAALARDAKATPLFRFSGWRLAFLGVGTGIVMAALLLAPGFYFSLGAMGLSVAALAADPAALGFLLALLFAVALYLSTLLMAATLVHEMGHALALAAFGHRGVTVSLLPFGGGVALGARDYASAFEAGAVSLAGPLLSALVALLALPDPERLTALIRGLLGPAPHYGAALLAFSGAAFAFLTLLVNIPNVLPWTGSDGALALGAIFAGRRMRQAAAGVFAALIAVVFGARDDLLPFGLMFLALSFYNRRRPEPAPVGGSGMARSLAIAGGLALVVGLYAHEAAILRRVDWRPPGTPEVLAPDRA